MKKANMWLLGGLVAALFGGSHAALSQGQSKNSQTIKGLPASDVLGSEDIWDNPTFVGGVIDGGPSASSEY
jgi:hypothetical protein